MHANPKDIYGGRKPEDVPAYTLREASGDEHARRILAAFPVVRGASPAPTSWRSSRGSRRREGSSSSTKAGSRCRARSNCGPRPTSVEGGGALSSELPGDFAETFFRHEGRRAEDRLSPEQLQVKIDAPKAQQAALEKKQKAALEAENKSLEGSL